MLFICACLRMNHRTKLTVVGGRPDFIFVFLCMNHSTKRYVSVELTQACPNNKISYACKSKVVSLGNVTSCENATTCGNSTSHVVEIP